MEPFFSYLSLKPRPSLGNSFRVILHPYHPANSLSNTYSQESYATKANDDIFAFQDKCWLAVVCMVWLNGSDCKNISSIPAVWVRESIAHTGVCFIR